MKISTSAISLALLSVTLVAPAATADCVDYGAYAHWIGSLDTPGPAAGVTVDGDLAYVAVVEGVLHQWSGLQIMDISDPANLVLIGSAATPANPNAVAISGTHAFLAESWGWHVGWPRPTLEVVDVADPRHPRVVGSVFMAGGGRAVAVSGTYAYVITVQDYGGTCALEVVDVTDPQNPTGVSHTVLPGPAYDLQLAGGYAYIAGHSSGLVVVDVSDPHCPAIAATLKVPLCPRGIALSGDLACVAAEGTYGGCFCTIDITEPTEPKLLASVATLTWANDVCIAGTIACVAARNLEIFDVADPANPRLIGRAGTPDRNACAVAFSRDHAFVADYDDGLAVIDLQCPATAFCLGSVATPGSASEVAVLGPTACVTDYYFEILDVSDPADPRLVGHLDTSPNWARSVAMAGIYAYGSVGPYGGYGRSGLYVINLVKPASPQIAGFVELPLAVDTGQVVVSGEYAYVSAPHYGLAVIDVSEPAQPHLVASLGEGGFHGLDVAGSYVYGADSGGGDDGLYVIDVSDPTDPRIVAHLSVPGTWDVAVSGSYAYLLGYTYALKVIDVTNPASPEQIGSLDVGVGLALSRLTVVDGVAYITARGLGLLVVDVRDPHAPRVIGSLCTPEMPAGVCQADSLVYLAGGRSGLQICPSQCEMTSVVTPSAATVRGPDLRVGPNPSFGQSSVLFVAPVSGRVSASILDAAGRQVRLLSDGVLSSGAHELAWDGRDDMGHPVAGGVYLARVAMGEATRTARLVLIR